MQNKSMSVGQAVSRFSRSMLMVILMAVPITVFCSGCGGTSQSDVRRHAIRRISEEEEEADTGPKAPTQTSRPSPEEGSGAPENPVTPRSEQRGTTSAVSDPRQDQQQQNVSSPIRPDKQQTLSEEKAFSEKVTFPTSRTESLAKADQSSSAPSSSSQEPLPLDQRIRRSAANLERISQAIQSYYKDHGAFPAASINVAGRPLLSWRVALLPYLGEQELYRQFKLDEPWNSRNNRTLLKSIPEVYQMPGIGNEHTTYLAVVGDSFALRPLHGRTVDEFADGPENTILIVDVDKSLAVPWTEPRDFRPPLPFDSTAKINPDGLLVLWTGGDVGWIPVETKPHLLMAMFTLEGGEPHFAYDIQRDIDSVLQSVEKSNASPK